MGDGRTRELKDVRIGDEVYGTKLVGRYRRYVKTQVLHHWRRLEAAYRIELEDGTTLVASADHRFLTERGWKYVAPGQRRQRPHLTPNNSLLGVGAFARPADETDRLSNRLSLRHGAGRRPRRLLFRTAAAGVRWTSSTISVWRSSTSKLSGGRADIFRTFADRSPRVPVSRRPPTRGRSFGGSARAPVQTSMPYAGSSSGRPSPDDRLAPRLSRRHLRRRGKLQPRHLAHLQHGLQDHREDRRGAAALRLRLRRRETVRGRNLSASSGCGADSASTCASFIRSVRRSPASSTSRVRP